MKLTVMALRNLGRNRRRSLLSAISIGVTAIAFLLVLGITEWMKSDIRENITTYISGDVRIRHIEFQDDESIHPLRYSLSPGDELVEEVLRVPGVKAVSPRIHLGSVVYRDGKTIPARGTAVNFRLEESFQALSDHIIQGGMPEPGSKNALFSRSLAEKLDLELHDSITLLLRTKRGASNAVTLKVHAIADFSDASANAMSFFASLPLMQRILRSSNELMEILIQSDGDVKSSALAERISRRLEETGFSTDQFSIMPWQEISQLWSIMRMAEISYAVLALILFLLGSTVIINTTIMTIHERSREIGMLGALGMEPGQIVRLFFLEASFLGVIGAAGGVLLGFLMGIPLEQAGIPMYDSILQDAGVRELSGRMFVKVTPYTAIVTFFSASVVASLSSYLPARKVSKIHPVEALRVNQ
ncbi:ABC transporter permease [Salinispira pacifica]|uniref:ABC transporter permease n=1 Tax=Salinispira pacifica TaxID=1307761 RepID=V5WJY2_9SPIO|nr:FtsX-like permease family protein [Salinispira pacifica]AHC15899.1 hypothetical protein L21SP2_2547 [Salinispira pacifica]